MLQDPDLIAAGLAALDPDEDGGEADDAARTERELAGVQAEEDRAIRLYVSGKISEQQLDHQRRFIGERLERLRARLDEHRARASAQAGRRSGSGGRWRSGRAAPAGPRRLPESERREVLDLLLEEATIDGENNVTLTLAIPADEEFVPIAKLEPITACTRCGRLPQVVRIGQTQPVQVVFMAYRNTLQADALKLVANSPRGSLSDPSLISGQSWRA